MKKGKKILSVILSLLMLFGIMPMCNVFAAEIVDSGICGGEGDGSNLTWILDGDGLLTISGNGNMGNYSYNSPWGSRDKNISSVSIQSGVTSIGNFAFVCCRNLTDVVIPDSVTSIGDSAFDGCISLTDVVIGNSVTSIGESAFVYCSNLTDVVIPESVTSIGESAFECCSDLTEIVIPDSVTSIGESAFGCCFSLTDVVIPDSVTSIGNSPFWGCGSLTGITVNENNQYYSSENGVLFDKDKTELIQYPGGNERSKYTVPDSVMSIGDFAFDGCISLTDVVIPDSVTSIGDSAFDGCISLTDVVIGNSVTSIGESAFDTCFSLTDVVIPDSVTSIGESAFEACFSLTDVVIPDSVKCIGARTFFCCISLKKATIYDPSTVFDGCKLGFTSMKINCDINCFVEKYVEYLNADIAKQDNAVELWIELQSLYEMYDEPIKIEDFTIYGYTESTAQEYAETYGFDFVPLDNAGSHIPGDEIIREPSCKAAGYKAVYCKECGEELSYEILPKLDHSYTGDVKNNNDGTHSFKCVNGCNEYGGTVECDYSERITLKEASVWEEGLIKSICNVCCFEKTETTDKIPTTTVENEETGISVSFDENAYPNGEMEVVIDEIADGEEYNIPQFAYANRHIINIKTVVDGVEVEPETPVVVKIPIPEGFNKNTITIWHIKDSSTGEREKVTDYRVTDGYVEFLAFSFSVYVIVDESSDTLNFDKNCSCNCHKSGIARFFWKIINFFRKLFKMEEYRYCDCGNPHW